MPTAYTPQLGFSLPTQGELSGTWGDVTNTSFTSLVDTAIAGTTTISTDLDVTLTATVGAANQARAAVLLCNGARTAIRNLTAPASSKIYYVINATTGGFAVVIRGSGPTTGVTVPAGKLMVVVWNGTDFVPAGGDASSLSGTLAIANGGTGATTAAAALLALGGVAANNAALTGIPTAPTAALGTATDQIATTAFAAALAFLAALPAMTGNANKHIITDGTNASWGFDVIAHVAGTSVAATAGQSLSLENVAAAVVTANPTPADNEELRVIANNGLTTNTVDFGTKVLRGPYGSLNIVQLDTPYLWWTFKFSTALNVWTL